MNETTVRNTQITSRETVTAGAGAYRNKTRYSTGNIENWTELKTISDNDDETQTVVDTNHQVAGFATVATRHEVVGSEEIRFCHSVTVDRGVEISGRKNKYSLLMKVNAGNDFKDQVSLQGTHETMRQLAETILATLDGEDA